MLIIFQMYDSLSLKNGQISKKKKGCIRFIYDFNQKHNCWVRNIFLSVDN